MNFVLSTLTLCPVVFVVHSCTWDDSKSLITDLLNTYDRRLIPVKNQSDSLKVEFAFDLMSIQDLDEVEGKVTVAGYMYLHWKDEKLTWNHSYYGGIYDIMLPLKDVWYPVIVLANSFQRITDISEDWMQVQVWSDGSVLYLPGDVFIASCSVDATYYPFDIQTCDLVFVSWGFNAEKVSLNLHSPHVLQTYFVENGEWDLTEAKSYCYKGRDEYNVDKVRLMITIKRRSEFVIVNILLPVLFMSLINISVFILPTETGERVSFALTVLLSLAIFLTLVVGNLPKTSKPIAILCYYLMCVLVTSVLMCLVTIFNIRIFYIDGDSVVPKFCLKICRVMCIKSGRRSCEYVQTTAEEIGDGALKSKESNVSWKDTSRALDRWSIVIFACVLISINMYYLFLFI